MLALPAVNPDTCTVATPELLVTAVAALKPRIKGSVAAKDTDTPDMDTPSASLTAAVSVALVPPAIREVPPELVKAILAPTTFTSVVTGLAVHPVHEAVSVAMRFVWSEVTAIMVTVAPISLVTTDALLRMTPFVAARSIVAPLTIAFPLVNAYTVKIMADVPSAFKTLELAALELILIAATLAFAEDAGVVPAGGVVAGALALPPPPPQAASAAAITRATTNLIDFIPKFL
jgi:hypothetical protein